MNRGSSQVEVVMDEAALRIGELARRTGVSASAIRFYERRRLMPAPERVAGQRRYGETALRRLGAIEAGKRAGLSLAELGDLFAATDSGAPAHERLRALAARKLPEVEARIERAEAARDWLSAADRCKCETLDSCALFG
jgi:DNA-binding transcriptional MerR regulator